MDLAAITLVGLKQGMQLWKFVPVLSISLFVLSLVFPRIANAQVTAAWFAGLLVLLSAQMFFAYLVIAFFLR
jgi:hypothetical protein